MNEVAWAAALLASYAVGTFPSAQLVAGRAVVQEGSGNPGASNTLRVAGRRAGAAVLALDLAKGALPTALALLAAGRSLAVACWVAAVVGHVFPAGRRFRGGKGVATGAGGSFVLYPAISLGLVAVFVVVARLFHRASLGSLTIAAGLVVGVVLVDRPWWEIGAVVAVVALVVVRHAGNIGRLVRRSELPVP